MSSVRLFNIFSIILGYFSVLLLLPTFLVMPGSGLDMSWQMALNEAVVQRMRLGTDIIFTFGPYASLYTHLYHPQLLPLIVLGSLSLALNFVIALMMLIPWKKFHGWLAISMLPFVILALSFPLKDGFFLLFPSVLLFYYITYENNEISKNSFTVWTWRIIGFGLIFNLAMISLIKGSFIISCWVSLILTCLYALFRRRLEDCIFLILSYLCFLCLLWKLAGQQIVDLPIFFVSIKEIASGYADAMSVSGYKPEILIYVLLSLSVLAVVWAFHIKTKIKLFIIIGIGGTLFLGFKSGFVRHDGHAMIAGSVLLGVVFLIYLLKGSIRVLILLFLAVALYAGIVWHYNKLSPLALGKEFVSRIIVAPKASVNLLCNYNGLRHTYDAALDSICKLHPLPKIEGNADILSYGQDRLIAAGIQYQPRPIFQSYSVYTSKLIEKNNSFIKGSRAPDNIFFAVEPIDGRLPALEDGKLWLALIGDYEFVSQQDNIAYFRRRNMTSITTDRMLLKDMGNIIAKLGEKVSLPSTQYPLWVEIEVQSTWLGYIGNALFKLPKLEIVIIADDGVKHRYRYIAGMGKDGFLISPLIENLGDFLILIRKQTSGILNKHIETIQINEASAWSGVWRKPKIKIHYFGIPVL